MKSNGFKIRLWLPSFVLKTSWLAGKIQKNISGKEFWGGFSKNEIKQMLKAACKELKKFKKLEFLRIASPDNEVVIII